ncbi:hypothetical protein QBC35DRAFT_381560, partial [Podospora australis]
SLEAVADRDTVLTARCHAVTALHEQFNRSESAMSNETIAAVVKLVVNDLCYGETGEIRVHVNGLHEMARARGGLLFLGRDGVLAKTFVESLTPVMGPVSTSAKPAFEEATSAILRDITFLIDTIVALPANPSSWQLGKVISMSEWVHNRLMGEAEGSSAAVSPIHTSIRVASLLYCEAIQARKPFSVAFLEQNILDLVDAVWKVPLETWNDTLGTLLWILIPMLPAAKIMPHCYTTKTMLMSAAVQLAMNDFDTALRTLDTALMLQGWLNGARS